MTKRSVLRDHAVSAAWGLAEGTVFFIVPDVWISWVATKNTRRSHATTVSALAGALAGGVITYRYSRRKSAQTTRDMLLKQPAVSRAMINRIEHEMADEGPKTLMRGPLRGAPYKIYARTAGTQDQSLKEFLAWSVPARMLRFIVVSTGFSAVTKAAKKRSPRHGTKIAKAAHLVFWPLFYTWFFKTTGKEDHDPSRIGD